MTRSHDAGTECPFDWMFTSVTDWGRLLIAAQELRHADGECLDALMEARTEQDRPLSPEDTAKVRSLIQMLKSIDLDPDTIRRLQPDTMQALESTCAGCTERDRCDHELARGTAVENRAEFCPNTPRLNALLGVLSASC